MAFIKAKTGKNGTTYYIVYNQKVRREDGSLTTKKKWLKVGKSKSDALRALRQFKQEVQENPSQFIAKETVFFQQFVTNEYLPWCQTRKTQSEYGRTAHAMALMMNFFTGLRLNELTPKRIEDYIAWRKQRPTRDKLISNRTVNIDLIYLSQCYKLAMEWGFIDANPCKKVSKLKETRNRVRFFSDEEIQRLLKAANPYVKRFLIVGISTGMRLQEMLNLKLSNIDFASNVIHIVNDDTFQTKNGRNRDIPISEYLAYYLHGYVNTFVHPRTFDTSPRTHAQSEYLFCHRSGLPIKSFKTTFKALLQKATITDATIHTMRHTFASHLVMKGVSIRTVQELMGHSSISVTEKYAHLSVGFKKKEIDLLDYGAPE